MSAVYSEPTNLDFGGLYQDMQNEFDDSDIYNMNMQSLNDMNMHGLNMNLAKEDNLSNVDPDVNCPVLDNTNRYWLPVDFNSEMKFDSKSLSLLHFNARSLNRNFDNIYDLITNQINANFSIYGFSETWIHPLTPKELFFVENYTFFHRDRTKSRGGGVAMLIHNSFNVKERADITLPPNLCESIFLEIQMYNRKNVIVGVIYRDPSSNIADFNDNINICLNQIINENKDVYVMGDWNINLLNTSSVANINDFLNIMYNNSFRPLINRPTRITKCSISLIDNIFTNVYAKQISSGILYDDTTDHLPIFSVTHNTMPYSQVHNNMNFTRRRVNPHNISNLNKALLSIDWNDILICDIEDAYNNFFKVFKQAFNDNCEIIKKKNTRSTGKKPWITHGLLKCIIKKNRLLKTFCKKRTKSNETKYKKYRNNLNAILRTARKKYYCDLLTKNKHNLKNVWQIINELMCKKKKQIFPLYFTKNNVNLYKNEDIVNEFNNFFSNIAANTLKQTNLNSNKQFSYYLKNPRQSSMYFYPTNELEIIKIVKELKMGYSTGFDDVSTFVVKKVIHSIVTPLVYIFNLSLSTGRVPNNLKIGKIIPVFKKGDKHLFSNYRPITLLPCFSKILEKIVYKRLISYLDKNKILNNCQYGFRAGHSCEHALIDLNNTLLTNIDNNKHSFGIFLDLSKAFDLIDHSILLYKLSHYGIRGTVWEWFQSYLLDRRNYTSFNNYNSSYSTARYGVPQGSVLGPLLFLLYINDLCTASPFFNYVLFADDTTIISTHSNFNILLEKTNNELCKIAEWFDANKLVVNYEKTNVMYFRKSHVSHTSLDFCIKMKDVTLNMVNSVKFLGFILDDNLSFNEHRLFICNKMSKNIGILYKLRSTLTEKYLFMLYNSLILPYIYYGNITWASCGITKLNPIHRLQKKALRICSNSPYLAPSRPIFSRLKTLTIFDIHKIQIAILMYYVKHNLAPRNITNLFLYNQDYHQYDTRSHSKFHYPLTRSQSTLNSFKSVGPRIWNSLSPDVTSCTNITSFKAKLKRSMISLYAK